MAYFKAERFSFVGRRNIPKYFSRDEVWAILKAAEDLSLSPFARVDKETYHLIFNLLWQTGARVSEVLALRFEDIDFYSKTLTLPNLKQGKESYKYLPLKDELLCKLERYIAIRRGRNGKDSRLFDCSRQSVFNFLKKVGQMLNLEPEKMHPHTFRHSFAVHCILNKVPIVVVKQWLGHSALASTLFYLEILSQDTREFYDQLRF